ncbi:MAG: hypothetical protein U1E56_00915 [Bauldia sp.]
MHRLAPFILLASLAGAFAQQPRSPTAAAPPPPNPALVNEARPFEADPVVRGLTLSEADCGLYRSAVWVTVEGKSECIRYFYSDRGGVKPFLLISISDDVVAASGAQARPTEAYLKQTPAIVQGGSLTWSQRAGGPYAFIARPGTFGSSGKHGERRRLREVQVVEAAIDAIKLRHNATLLHLAGHSGGAHIVATLLARRSDIGCVAIGSGIVSMKTRLTDLGRRSDVTGLTDFTDPFADVGKIEPRESLKLFILTDPDDREVSMRSQVEYGAAAKAQGVDVTQIFAKATGDGAHDLQAETIRTAIDCIKGMPAADILAKYQNKPPGSPRPAAPAPATGVVITTPPPPPPPPNVFAPPQGIFAPPLGIPGR